MATAPWSVEKYSPAAFHQLLSSRSKAPEHIIEEKLQSEYFDDYFGDSGIKAETMLVEHPYVDRDYLADFSGYYVKCFRRYRRKCTRIHFFDLAFTKEDFSALLSGKEAALTRKQLQDSYLGFIVIKPLPQTIFGRTCLSTYRSDNGRRHFVRRKYDVGLFGTALQVKSLAFQEQDTVTAACATSSLWAAFHATGMLFHHHIPSPVEITKAATDFSPFSRRALPNDGLNMYEMANAIKAVGLEPFPVETDDETSNEQDEGGGEDQFLGDYILKSTAYAYLRAGIPIIMLESLKDISKGHTPKMLGYHAVTISGYSLGLDTPIPEGDTDFALKASRIDKLYVHDDQVGPYARMEFTPWFLTTSRRSPLVVPGDEDAYIVDSTGRCGNVGVFPDALLVPLYQKIRIPYETAHDAILVFDSLLGEMHNAGVMELPERMEWDVYLSCVNEFKKNIFRRTDLTGPLRQHILERELPRFIWIADAWAGEEIVLSVIFDATDIEQGELVVLCIEKSAALRGILTALAGEKDLMDDLRSDPKVRAALPIMNWYARAGAGGA